MIDLIFEKIKCDKIKKLHPRIILYLLSQTSNFSEVLFIKNKLEFFGIIMSSKRIISLYLNFVEDYIEARKVLENLFKAKVKIDSLIYSYIICTTDTQEQARQVFDEMVSSGIKPSVKNYIDLLEKQNMYEDARKILNEYILIEEFNRKCLYSKDNKMAIHIILPILYLKAKKDDQIQQIKKELKSAGMSTNIDEYKYLCIKSSKRNADEVRRQLLEPGIASSILESVNEFLGINSNEHKKVKNKNNNTASRIEKIANVYVRDKSISNSIKDLYSNFCQICGERLDIGNGFYSEVHHIHPLYLDGPDSPENMLCLCPNHHTLFDKGAMTINLDNRKTIYINGTIEELKLLEHDVHMIYVDYHNNYIYNKKDILLTSKVENTKQVADYGCKVIMININSSEEIAISIPTREHENSMSYSIFQIINHKKDDKLIFNGEEYLLKHIVNSTL